MNHDDAFARFLDAQAAYHHGPSPENCSALWEALNAALLALRSRWSWKFTAKNSEEVFSYSVRWDKGDWVVSHQRLSVLFDEVKNSYLTRMMARYQREPGFTVTTSSFLQSGCAMEARTMLRTEHRQHKVRSAVGKALGPRAQSPDGDVGSRPGEPSAALAREDQLPRELWFHTPGQAGRPSLAGFAGLSLRFCYVSLRIAGGATQLDVATELGVNQTQMSKLKHEMDPFARSGVHPKGWLALDRAAPVHFDPKALEQLGLAGGSSSRSLWHPTEPSDADGSERWLHPRKLALWAVYETTLEVSRDSAAVATGSATAPARLEPRPGLVVDVETRAFAETRAVHVLAVSGLEETPGHEGLEHGMSRGTSRRKRASGTGGA